MIYATVTQRLSDFFPRNLPKEEQVYRNYTLPQQFWPYYTDPSYGAIRYNTYVGNIVSNEIYDVRVKGGYFNYIDSLDRVYNEDGTYRYNVVIGYSQLTSVNGNSNIYIGRNSSSFSLNTDNTISIGQDIFPEENKIILRPNGSKGQLKITPPQNQNEVYNIEFVNSGDILLEDTTIKITDSTFSVGSGDILLEDTTIKITDSTFSVGNSAFSDKDGMYSYAFSSFSEKGDSQKSNFEWRGISTSNSYFDLYTNSTNGVITIPTDKFWSGTINVLGIRTNGENCARYMRQVTIGNVGGNVQLYGSVSTIGTDVNASKTIGLTTYNTELEVTANNTNNSLRIRVRGLPSENMRWMAFAEGIELKF